MGGASDSIPGPKSTLPNGADRGIDRHNRRNHLFCASEEKRGNLNRRRFLKYVGAGAVAIGGVAAGYCLYEIAQEPPPRVLVMVLEDFQLFSLHCKSL